MLQLMGLLDPGDMYPTIRFKGTKYQLDAIAAKAILAW